MLESAMEEGRTSEKKMWEEVECISNLIESLRDEHPRLYWDFMRKQYGSMFDRHYGKQFADHDVSMIIYTDRDGERRDGCHWTADEIERATSGMAFPEGTTKWDKYVAFNSAYADFCKIMSDEEVLRVGYSFFFADEDWPSRTKVWDYNCCKPI